MTTTLTLAYSGDGTAAKAISAGSSIAPTHYATAEVALVAVKAEQATLALLLVEHPSSGTSHGAYDLLLKYQLVIVGEHREASGARFLLLAKEVNAAPVADNEPKKQFKTSIVFAFTEGDEFGQLHRAIGVFATRRINLVKIESRPWTSSSAAAVGAGTAPFLFYADITGQHREPRVTEALAALRELCHFVRVLGSYASDGGMASALTAISNGESDSMTTKYPLNPIFESVPIAKTLAIFGITKQLEAAGHPVYSLCVGEPDFSPPERAINAGIHALEQRNVKYSDMRGDLRLRSIIAEYLTTAKGTTYDPEDEIQVSNGAQQALYMVLYSLVRSGDKVIVPSPYWGSYEAIVRQVRAGLVVLRGKIEEGYLISPQALEATLTANPETKVLILCNPSNPAGTLHSPDHLEQIAAVLRKPQFRHVVIISDEIYEQLIYQDEEQPSRVHKSFATLPGMFERTVLINGFSKAYAMTGMRIGFVAGPRYFVRPCLLLQAQLTSTANMVGQMAAVEALKEELECIKQGRLRIADVLTELDTKRRYVIQRLSKIPKLKFAYPTSAFYVFMDLSEYFKDRKALSADGKHAIDGVADFCELMLREHHVAAAPGVDFGDEFGLRISYAGAMDTLVHGIDGIEQTLQSLTFE